MSTIDGMPTENRLMLFLYNFINCPVDEGKEVEFIAEWKEQAKRIRDKAE